MIVTDAGILITRALAQALERMAFLDVLPCPESPEMPTDCIQAEIRFHGSVSGSIQIAAGLAFARELASNMGLMEGPTEFHCLDAVGELVNVTCGLVLPMLARPDADVFDVSIPQAFPCKESAGGNRWIRRDDAVVLLVGEHPIAVRLILEP